MKMKEILDVTENEVQKHFLFVLSSLWNLLAPNTHIGLSVPLTGSGVAGSDLLWRCTSFMGATGINLEWTRLTGAALLCCVSIRHYYARVKGTSDTQARPSSLTFFGWVGGFIFVLFFPGRLWRLKHLLCLWKLSPVISTLHRVYTSTVSRRPRYDRAMKWWWHT